MRRALATFALLLAFPAPAAALDSEELGSRLLRDLGRAGAASGGYARDLDTGAVFVSVRPDTPRIPASVEKLFVSVASLERRGATDTIPTRAMATVPPDALGTIAGDLVLVGGGDPTLSESTLRRLAQSVADAGVRRVNGSVLGDESLFDRLRGGPRTGGKPDYDMSGRLGALVIARGYQPSPALHAAKKFVSALRRLGVRVVGRTGTGTAREDATEVAALGSAPLAILLRDMNVPSDNFLAEMLLKRLGAVDGGAGTSAAGARVARAALAKLDIRPTIIDGSGLSRSNRTTPRQVVDLFRKVEERPYRDTLRGSLAVTGRTGTVRRRMRRSAARGRCQVKTGTLNGVSNLVGVCRARGGNDIAFAWMMSRIDVWTAHKIQDRLTATLVKYDG